MNFSTMPLYQAAVCLLPRLTSGESPLRGVGMFMMAHVELLSAPSWSANPPENARLQQAMMNV